MKIYNNKNSIFLSVILLDSVTDNYYYLQIFLEQRKYAITKKNINNTINE